MQRLRIPIWDRFTRLKNFKSFTIVQSQCTIVKKNRLVECNSKIGIGDLRPRNLDLNTWPCCRHLLSFAYSLLLFVFTICNAWFAFWSLLLQFTTIDSDYLEHHLTVLHTAVKPLVYLFLIMVSTEPPKLLFRGGALWSEYVTTTNFQIYSFGKNERGTVDFVFFN